MEKKLSYTPAYGLFYSISVCSVSDLYGTNNNFFETSVANEYSLNADEGRNLSHFCNFKFIFQLV